MIVVSFPIRSKNFLFITVSLPNLKSIIFFSNFIFQNFLLKWIAWNVIWSTHFHLIPRLRWFGIYLCFPYDFLVWFLIMHIQTFFYLSLSLTRKCFLGNQLRQIYYLKSNFNSLHQLLEHGLFCYATHCRFICFINVLRTLLFNQV